MLGGGAFAASTSSPPPRVGLVRRGAATAGMAALWMAAPVAASAASAASASAAAEAAAPAAAAAVAGGERLGWSWLRPASEMAAAHGSIPISAADLALSLVLVAAVMVASARLRLGRAVHVDPIKPTLKAPGTKRLKL